MSHKHLDVEKNPLSEPSNASICTRHGMNSPMFVVNLSLLESIYWRHLSYDDGSVVSLALTKVSMASRIPLFFTFFVSEYLAILAIRFARSPHVVTMTSR